MAFLAALGGVSPAELAKLEIVLLMALGFEVTATREEYNRFVMVNCGSSSPPGREEELRASVLGGAGVPDEGAEELPSQ